MKKLYHYKVLIADSYYSIRKLSLTLLEFGERWNPTPGDFFIKPQKFQILQVHHYSFGIDISI